MDDDDDFGVGGEEDDFGSGDEFCDFDDDGEDNNSDPVEMEETGENLYYKAKSIEEDSADEASKILRRVVELEEQERSEYGFKALKKLVKMTVRGDIQGTDPDIIRDFKSMLKYSDMVSINMMEKGINAILDRVVATKKLDLMVELAQLSAECFQQNSNERAWFRVNLKVAQMMYEAGELQNLPARLTSLVTWCELAPGVNNPKKESFLLEVLALQMQCAMSGAMTGPNGLRRLVSRASTIQSAIPHPRTLGTLHECTGKVMLFEHKWSNAKQEFFDAFRNYDESGSPRRVMCLRYITLAALLENTNISPFESPETKSLVSHEEIVPVVELWNAFEKYDVDKFNSAVKKAYAGDNFALQFIPTVVRCFQYQKISDIVKAYSKVKITFIADQLKIDVDECEAIIVEFIIDGRLDGTIDQINKVLLMKEEGADEVDTKYKAMGQWSRHVQIVTGAIGKKIIKDEH